ncbi:hypothetical protein [Azospirillum griseum]|uniref:Uncharacterized protein n=1 Tax=Azospirillum griseum TaxID=2496639 RepID=A0A431VGJ5_9PROT|nr:hypothetical protein [Azospirillum griseum]RTR19788.1 hypothetical protein EJ903_12335 [Azospirillum griseum]
MTEPVLVDFNKITFPPDPSEISGLMVALEKIVKDPYTCDKQRMVDGELLNIVSAHATFSPNVVGGIIYQVRQKTPPTGTYYMVAGKPSTTPYTLVTIKRMVVSRR